VSFFTHDALLKAKEVLHGDLAISFRLIKCQKDDDNVLDLCKWLATAAEEKRVMPIFAIYSSTGIIFNHDPLLKAKEVLYGDLAVRFRLIKCQKDDDNVLDLCKWIATAAKGKRVMPIFSSSGIYL
jgi:hypothetical protein